MLYSELIASHNSKKLLTNKLNQDCLENLFSQLRTKGGLCDHPSPLNVLHKLHMIVLGKLFGGRTNESNTDNKIFCIVNVFKQCYAQTLIFEESFSSKESIDNNGDVSTVSDSDKSSDALQYLAGWIAKKLNNEHPALKASNVRTNTRM